MNCINMSYVLLLYQKKLYMLFILLQISGFQFFGFCAMVAYGIDAFLKFQAFKRGELAQGQRVTTKQTSVISPAN